MATGRTRRTAQRGIAAAVLGWLVVATFSLLTTPSAAAAQAVTVEIMNLTPPAASVDPHGTVTFVNKIPPANKGGISVSLVGSFSATVYTDVAVTFFGEEKKLELDQSAAWSFSAPVTTGTITYTYRIVPQGGLSAAVANQVVNSVASTLPALPAPTPYIVQTVAPAVPNLPGVNVPRLPQIAVELPIPPLPTDPSVGPPPPPAPAPAPAGNRYLYDTSGGAARLAPSAVAAASAFDAARWAGESGAPGGPAAGPGGSGGLAGGYDGAPVPSALSDLDGTALEGGGTATASDSRPAPRTLPAAALAAILALAAVSGALVHTHQTSRTRR